MVLAFGTWALSGVVSMDDYDEKKMAFERDKAVFEQNCGQLRTLIPELHKKPLMAATLTGALLTAMSVFKLESRYTIGLFALIAVMNAFIGITCLRLRDVIESYIEKASLFSPDFGAKGGRPSKSSKPRSTPIFRPSIQAEKRNRWPISESLLSRDRGRAATWSKL
jgi:hypothetical protein